MIHLALTALPWLLAPAAAEDDVITAYVVFVKLAEEPDSELFAKCFAKEAFAHTPPDQKPERTRELATILTTWSLKGTRQEEGLAAVEVEKEKSIRDILLVQEGDDWKIQTVTSYLVAGPDLKERVGKKPAKLKLPARTAHDYDGSAFSFAYVTADPEECKNRVDLWFCHNRDLHAASGRLLEVGKTSLKKLDRIPLSTEWSGVLPARKGKSYVLHCLDRRDRDFYVELTLKKVSNGAVELEWSLLGFGVGAPPDLKGPHPVDSIDGADAVAGLCGKN